VHNGSTFFGHFLNSGARRRREPAPCAFAVIPDTDLTIPDLPFDLVNRTWSLVERALARQARWQPVA
jgi:hypothetical protein